MTYLISDIHSDYKGFLDILHKISYNNQDMLILVGDIVDRGAEPLRLLKYVKRMVQSEDYKVILLKGNHEFFFQMYLQGMLSAGTWDRFGGQKTRQEVDELSQIEKHELQQFIKNLPIYTKLNSPIYGETIVVHSGIDIDYLVYNEDGFVDVEESIQRGVKENEYQFLISGDIHDCAAAIRRKLDKYIICGHVPTTSLNLDGSYRVYKGDSYMDIDTGNGHKANGGCLSCYCVETDQVVTV